MRAAVIHEYGTPDVLKIEEIPDPVPGPKEVLIRVHASSINPIDWKIRNGSLRFLIGRGFPKVLGFDLCGRVKSTGAGADKFQKGDWVYARSDRKTGQAYAELVVTSEDTLAIKPEALSAGAAAAIPLAGLTALQALRDHGGFQRGHNVLVLGASGGVGSFAVQIARALGATVTGVCSGANRELVMSLGARRVIDYRKENALEAGEKYNVIFDAVARYGFPKTRPLLTEEGSYVTTLPSLAVIFAMFIGNYFSRKKAQFFRVKPLGRDLELLSGLVAQGKLKPAIDSRFPLSQIAQAHRHSESHRAQGKIIVEIEGE